MSESKNSEQGFLSSSTRLILGLISVGWFLTLGTRFLIPAILPQIKAEFAIGNTTAGIAITVIWAGYGLMQFPAGVLVDRFGERTLLSLSLLLAGVSLGLIGIAPIFIVFMIGAGLFGLTSGLFGPSRGIALSRFFGSKSGRAFGIALAAGSIGSASLPLVGSYISQRMEWELAVLAIVPLFIGTGLATWFVLPEGTNVKTKTIVSRRTQLRLLARPFADRTVVIAFVGLMLVLFTFQGLTAFLPTYLIQEKGLAPGTANALFALLFIAGAGFQLVGGNAVDRVGTRPVVLPTAVVGVLMLVLLPFIGGVVALSLLIVILSSRIAIVSMMNPYILEQLSDEKRGAVWGMMRTGLFVIGATGSSVVGLMSDRGLFAEAFFLLAGVTGVAAVLFALLE